jgi:hypothetical protein
MQFNRAGGSEGGLTRALVDECSIPVNRHTFLKGVAGVAALAATRKWAAGAPVSGLANAGQASMQTTAPAVITIDLSRETGRTVHPFLYGYATGALLDNDFRLAVDKSVEASGKALASPLLRIDTSVSSLVQKIFTKGTSRPDWSLISRWVQHRGDFVRPGGRLVFGIGPAGGDTTISPATWAKYARSIATHFREIGQEITFWEIGNECDPMGAVAYSRYFNAIADALHSVSPAFLVGGPVASWWNGIDLPTFIRHSGSRLGFIDFHSYPVNHTDSLQTALAKAASFSDIASARKAVAGTRAENLPIGLLEYNMNAGKQSNGKYGIPQQGTITGAVYAALLLTRAFASDLNFTMGAVWDLVADSNFGVIGNAQANGNYRNIDSQGWYLRQAARVMPGQQVVTAFDDPGLQVLATRAATHFSVQLVNYNLHKATSVAVNVKGRKAGSQAELWEMSARYPRGHASATKDLGRLTVPPQSIVMIRGFR